MIWLNISRIIPQQILPYSFVTAIKRKPLITKQIRWININLSSRYLKTTSACQKSQTVELEYSTVQNWSPNEVNLFLKEKFAKDWEILKKFGFEKHDVTGNELLEMKVNDLYNAGLPFLLAKKLEIAINAIKKTFYIQDYNDEGELLEKFYRCSMSDEDDFRDFLKTVGGKGLESIDDNSEAPRVIRSLRHIRPNQHYRINAFHLTAVTSNAIKKQKKTFYIQAYNDEDGPLERFEKYTMYSEDDFHDFLTAVDGKGLESIDDNNEAPKVIRSLRHIHPNQHYKINAPHITEDTINAIKKPKKTFYIQAYNREGEPLERFETYTMYNEEDFCDFLKAINGTGLESINDNGEVITVIRSLSQIRPNQHYRINASYLKKRATWSIIEDQAMEEETLLAVQNALIEKINGPTKIFSKRVMFDQEGKSLIKWDGILICEDRVFLCEAKHNMTLNRIYNLVRRLQEFPKKLEATSDLEFKQLLRKQYIGVACETRFPGDVRRSARDIFGLIVVFPGDGRYNVEMPEKFGFSPV
ncbi:hypothetical protein F8M41_000953 [Gigaspora margarita]|uniref:SAM domain-containing protein n=1 Tax=Gigaspora margarita TaxID=4874 RepID=A0A8H3XF53_GIGMA|nr:hypothetical protein F8M41_000953 [Gigaspora margarita]